MVQETIKKRRPTICPDSKCQVLWSNFLSTSFEEGYSFDCVGKLAEPHEFRWREVTHINEYCYCVYTPLKGLTRWLMAALDAEGSRHMMEMILRDAKPLVCSECGEKGFAGLFWQFGEKVYCAFCLVRKGIVRWEDNRYVWYI